MLLSAATYEEYTDVEVSRAGLGFFNRINGSQYQGEDLFLHKLSASEQAHVVAAYVYWQGIDLLSEGGDGDYDNETIVFNGVEITGESLGTGDTFGRGDGGSQAFRADVRAFLRPDVPYFNFFYGAGFASKPGHRLDKVYVVALSQSHDGTSAWLQTGGVTHPQDLGFVRHMPPVVPSPPPVSVPRPVAADLQLSVTYVDGSAEYMHGWQVGTRRFDEYEIVTPPSVGEVTIRSDGTNPFDYVAPVNLSGEFSFTYRVRDGLHWSEPATVRIRVAQRATPITVDLALSGDQNEPLVGRLMSSSTQIAQVFEVVGRPTVGTVSLDCWTGDFVFTPPRGFSGIASFQYRTWDGLYSQASTVTLSIAPISQRRQPVTPVVGVIAQDDDFAEPKLTVPEVLSTIPAEPDVSTISEARPKASRTAPADPVGIPQRKRSSERAVKSHVVLYTSEQPVAEPSQSDGLRPPKPAIVTVVVMSNANFEAADLARNTLRLERHSASGTTATEASHSREFDKPRNVTYRDVNGDGHEDLIAVFKLDWAELWDGYEQAVLTGRLVGDQGDKK
ncbi:MAG: Ig-like domain-containing protein [Planctomycetaceae bacterium]|nr:Ig-like domain-containing protein [Planctomycetaceae bacterium]